MQLSQAPTKILQAASPGWNLQVSCFCFCFDNIGLFFMYYYVVHPHTQYRGTMLQQEFWCWDLLIKHAAMWIV